MDERREGMDEQHTFTWRDRKCKGFCSCGWESDYTFFDKAERAHAAHVGQAELREAQEREAAGAVGTEADRLRPHEPSVPKGARAP